MVVLYIFEFCHLSLGEISGRHLSTLYQKKLYNVRSYSNIYTFQHSSVMKRSSSRQGPRFCTALLFTNGGFILILLMKQEKQLCLTAQIGNIQCLRMYTKNKVIIIITIVIITTMKKTV